MFPGLIKICLFWNDQRIRAVDCPLKTGRCNDFVAVAQDHAPWSDEPDLEKQLNSLTKPDMAVCDEHTMGLGCNNCNSSLKYIFNAGWYFSWCLDVLISLVQSYSPDANRSRWTYSTVSQHQINTLDAAPFALPQCFLAAPLPSNVWASPRSVSGYRLLPLRLLHHSRSTLPTGGNEPGSMTGPTSRHAPSLCTVLPPIICRSMSLSAGIDPGRCFQKRSTSFTAIPFAPICIPFRCLNKRQHALPRSHQPPTGNEDVTVIKKIRGDPEAFRKEIEFLCQTRASYGKSGFLQIVGNHRRVIKGYLQSIGYWSAEGEKMRRCGLFVGGKELSGMLKTWIFEICHGFTGGCSCSW